MKTLTMISVLTFFITLSCSNEIKNSTDVLNLKSDTTEKDSAIQIKALGLLKSRQELIHNSLPIHGTLNQKQIDQYYPKILDTIKDHRIIGSEPIDIHKTTNIYVSMLHNTGTFDQMFLCTHDKYFNLLDSYYIGKSTMFDKASHTIEYKKISDGCLEFYHVDWEYVKKNDENEIDTLKCRKFILTVTKTGKIEKR